MATPVGVNSVAIVAGGAASPRRRRGCRLGGRSWGRWGGASADREGVAYRRHLVRIDLIIIEVALRIPRVVACGKPDCGKWEALACH